MKLKLSKLLLFLVVPTVLLSQTSSNERLMEMKNCFNLGLHEKGLEIASELMSRNEFKDVREETVFFIAEYHFIISLVQNDIADKSTNANRAYTYYIVYKNDYPNSKYSAQVDKRITTLNSTASYWAILRNLFDYYFTEASIVENSITFTNNLFSVSPPYPYNFFFEGDNQENAIQILERYYDDIIVNHPEFEIYGYYWKIISNLSVIDGINYFDDGLLKFNVDKIDLYEKDVNNKPVLTNKSRLFKHKIDGWLNYLKNKYPHDPITLDLNLIFAKIFMLKDDDDNIDMETKTHLEFVVQNELDKTHPRYMLAKEFLLNNKFK